MTAAVKILRGRPILSIRRQPKIIRINTGGQGPRGLSGREMLFAPRRNDFIAADTTRRDAPAHRRAT